MTSQTETLHIPLKQLVENPDNPRRGVDEDGIAYIAKTMKADGQLQPIVVREVEGGRYGIIDGHQRFAAAKAIGLKTLRAELRQDADDDIDTLRKAMIANSARIAPEPYADAIALGKLRDAGVDLDELRDALGGRSPKWLRDRLALLDACPEVAEALEDGTIALRSAVALCQVSPARQRAVLAEATRGGRAAHSSVQHALESDRLTQAPWDLDDASLGQQACTTCPYRSDRQPDLFASTTGGAAKCLDASCWASKLKALRDKVPDRFYEGSVWQNRELVSEHTPSTKITPDVWLKLRATIAPVYADDSWRVTKAWRAVDVERTLRQHGHDGAADDVRRDHIVPKPKAAAQSTQKDPRPTRAAMNAAQRQIVAAYTAGGAIDYEAILAELVPELGRNVGRNPLKAIAKRRMLEDSHFDASEIDRADAGAVLGALLDLVLQASLDRATCQWTREGLAEDSAWVRLCKAKGIEIPEHVVRG